MGENSMFGEGASTNRPPLFAGANYAFWKIRMKIFMESMDRGIWDAVVNGPYIPKCKSEDGSYIEKPWEQWTELESRRAQYDCKAKNIITSALSMDEFFRVSQCESAKEMWDNLEVTHEGTLEVKRARKHTLIQEYEMFRMQPNETIQEVQKRFTHIVNHLAGLGKSFEKEELNIKILKCLSREWQPKVTAISESKDLTSMSAATLFGKLREHELELNRLKSQENSDNKRKSLALKVKNEMSEDESEKSEDEELSMIVRKFGKFLKKRNQQYDREKFNGKKDSKKSDLNVTNLICFNCGQQGHLRADCPQRKEKLPSKYEKKSLKNVKSKDKSKKNKSAYIAWEENDSSSSSDSSEECDNSANLCLIGEIDSVSQVSSSSSSCSENYSQLYNAFSELHDEARKQEREINRLKGMNNWLENRVNQLEKELEENRNKFEALEKKNIESDESMHGNCTECKKLQDKVAYLIKTLGKFSVGSSNLNALLGSQMRTLNREGIGYSQRENQYNQSENKKTDEYEKLHKKQSTVKQSQSAKIQTVICNYCRMHGHTSFNCHFRRYHVPQGLYVWKVKDSICSNITGPKKKWVPLHVA